MFERFDTETRKAVTRGSAFAKENGDKILHTGHLLYGIFDSGVSDKFPLLVGVADAPSKISSILSGEFPENLVQNHRRVSRTSDAQAFAFEKAMYYTRSRRSKAIILSDLLLGMLTIGPNLALYLLKKLGVDPEQLREELELAHDGFAA